MTADIKIYRNLVLKATFTSNDKVEIALPVPYGNIITLVRNGNVWLLKQRTQTIARNAIIKAWDEFYNSRPDLFEGHCMLGLHEMSILNNRGSEAPPVSVVAGGHVIVIYRKDELRPTGYLGRNGSVATIRDEVTGWESSEAAQEFAKQRQEIFSPYDLVVEPRKDGYK